VDRPLLLIDTPSLYFRAYFGIPESAARAPDGSPVNAVRGLLDMLSTLIRTRKPDRLVCAFDHDWRPAWRVALIDTYKKHRLTPSGGEEVPDNLSPQVPIILEALAALGIPCIGASDYEADDVLGTLATTQPGPVEVVSGDRDLFQLIDDDKPIRLLYCGKGIANLDVCDNAFVQAKYGVAASQYADFAALRGDPSDGLPGVSGVGEKTAARLIVRYGSLANIIAALDDPAAGFAPGVKAKLVAAADYLAVAPTVVEVARDVKLPAFDCALPPNGPKDADALLKLAETYNLASPTRRIVDAIAGVA
jgi:5'-3' exonuclease